MTLSDAGVFAAGITLGWYWHVSKHNPEYVVEHEYVKYLPYAVLLLVTGGAAYYLITDKSAAFAPVMKQLLKGVFSGLATCVYYKRFTER